MPPYLSLMSLSLPNLLTLGRIAAIPPAVALFYVPAWWADWALLLLFGAAALTDWLDGYLARMMKEESMLGRFLDPVADKLLVAALLFMLGATNRLPDLSVLPAVMILMREVLISGLREFLAGLGAGLPVSRMAKWKTAVQMAAIMLLIFGRHHGGDLTLDRWGAVALWLAAILTVITGWSYLKIGWGHMAATEKK